MELYLPPAEHCDFFDWVDELFIDMSAKIYSYAHMKRISGYDKVNDTSNLVVPMSTFTRAIDLLIAAFSEADIRLCKNYLPVIKLLFAHVGDDRAALRYVFGLEFFSRRNREKEHDLWTFYEDFEYSVDRTLDEATAPELDGDFREIVRRLGFFFILHPVFVLKRAIFFCVVYIHSVPEAVSRVMQVFERLPSLFELQLPTVFDCDSEAKDFAFIQALRKMIDGDGRLVNLAASDAHRRNFAETILLFVRTRFWQGLQKIVVKRPLFDATVLTCFLIFDYLARGFYVKFFLRLLNEMLRVREGASHSDNSADAKELFECVINVRVVAEENDEPSIDFFLLSKLLIDLYVRKPPAVRPSVASVLKSLSEKIRRDNGSNELMNVSRDEFGFLEDAVMETDWSFQICVREWFSNIIYGLNLKIKVPFAVYKHLASTYRFTFSCLEGDCDGAVETFLIHLFRFAAVSLEEASVFLKSYVLIPRDLTFDVLVEALFQIVLSNLKNDAFERVIDLAVEILLDFDFPIDSETFVHFSPEGLVHVNTDKDGLLHMLPIVVLALLFERGAIGRKMSITSKDARLVYDLFSRRVEMFLNWSNSAEIHTEESDWQNDAFMAFSRLRVVSRALKYVDSMLTTTPHEFHVARRRIVTQMRDLNALHFDGANHAADLVAESNAWFTTRSTPATSAEDVQNAGGGEPEWSVGTVAADVPSQPDDWRPLASSQRGESGEARKNAWCFRG